MKPRGILKRGYAIGRDYLAEKQEAKRQQDAEEAKWQAQREQAAKDRERYLKERKVTLTGEQTRIDSLARYAGRLVVMTNPQFRLRTKRFENARATFTGTLADVFESGSQQVQLSTHATQERLNERIQRDFDDVVDILSPDFAARGIYLSRHSRGESSVAGSYVTPVTQDGRYYHDIRLLDSLAEALHDTDTSAEGTAQGHIAITSAFGMPSIGLGYSESRFGNAYLLNGIDSENRVDWQQLVKLSDLLYPEDM